MTLDEIKKLTPQAAIRALGVLPNEELDRLAAEAQGWRHENGGAHCWCSDRGFEAHVRSYEPSLDVNQALGLATAVFLRFGGSVEVTLCAQGGVVLFEGYGGQPFAILVPEEVVSTARAICIASIYGLVRGT